MFETVMLMYHLIIPLSTYKQATWPPMPKKFSESSFANIHQYSNLKSVQDLSSVKQNLNF